MIAVWTFLCIVVIEVQYVIFQLHLFPLFFPYMPMLIIFLQNKKKLEGQIWCKLTISYRYQTSVSFFYLCVCICMCVCVRFHSHFLSTFVETFVKEV